MLSTDRLPHPRFLLAGLAILALLTVAGCTIHEDKKEGEKKVDIKTPFANLKVDTEVSATDTGLPAYPGARRKPGDEHDRHAANVNLSGFGFGLKLFVIEFESDDPPEKVLAFYKDKMKAFGNVLECRDTSYVSLEDPDKESEQLTCGKSEHHGEAVELKVGIPAKQRIVAVKPRGSGSDFALVYLQTRGKGDMM